MPDSIKVFDPVNAEAMRNIWPDFDKFSTLKWTLPFEQYDKFESYVRTRELAAGDAADDAYIPRSGDERPIAIQQIRARRGARGFRDGLLDRFNATCLVTGCRVKDLLEAAHIHPYRGETDNDLRNGLLLRADIHTLVDLHLLGIEPRQLKVEMHPKLKKDDYYRDLDGKLLNVTDEARPSPDALRELYDAFRRSAAIG